MTRRKVAAAVVLALLGAGCSGDHVARKAAAAIERHHAGPAPGLAVERSTWLPGEPGGMAADLEGTVVAVDDRTVVAYDAHGSKRWSSSVAGAALGWPWLGDGLVVVPTLSAQDLGEDVAGPDDSGGCVAVDRATGERRWSHEEEGLSGVAVAGAEGRVFCVFRNGTIAAVDTRTGALAWRVLLDPRATPARVDVSERTALVIDTTTHTLALTAQMGSHWYLALRDLATGTDRADLDLGIAPSSAPVVIGPGQVAVGAGSGHICTLDLRRLVSPPCLAVPAPDGFDPAGVPLAVNGTVLIAGRDGSVSAVDLDRRRVRWTKTLPTPVLDSRPVVVGDVVLLADWTRVPWALHVSDGSEVGVPSAAGFVVSAGVDGAGPGRGFAVAVRGDPDGRIERWRPSR